MLELTIISGFDLTFVGNIHIVLKYSLQRFNLQRRFLYFKLFNIEQFLCLSVNQCNVVRRMFPVGFILLRVDTCVYTQVAFIELFLQLWDSKIEERKRSCVLFRRFDTVRGHGGIKYRNIQEKLRSFNSSFEIKFLQVDR